MFLPLLVTSRDLENFADTRLSQGLIPELVDLLIRQSVSNLRYCRIPHGDAIGQRGADGRVETPGGYGEFVPAGESVWEFGSGADPRRKATEDLSNRTRSLEADVRSRSTFVFVTPRSSGWDGDKQQEWCDEHRGDGWKSICVIDGVRLEAWLREFPAIGMWLLRHMDDTKSVEGMEIPKEHWENLEALSAQHGDPPLPPALFLTGRDEAIRELGLLFRGEKNLLCLGIEAERDAEDFVAAYLASIVGTDVSGEYRRCLFVGREDTWRSLVSLGARHVFVAHPRMDLVRSGEQLHLAAMRRGHGVVIPIDGGGAVGGRITRLSNPSALSIRGVLSDKGYSPERARELSEAGAHSLAALKRVLRGLGELPPYAGSSLARQLAQATLIGGWLGNNAADREALEQLLGKSYGEWIETLRPESLRSDTPLHLREDQWRVSPRGEAWTALGPHLFDEDLDLFAALALRVLGETHPKFDVSPSDTIAELLALPSSYSGQFREGIAESLALLGTMGAALTSCSTDKATSVAVLSVRRVLAGASWKLWASLGPVLPMLAEAAPTEFLNQVEEALEREDCPFRSIFERESDRFVGANHMTGLLWALETLAWRPDLLVRVISILGGLASIDPGGHWADRPLNSIRDILLPWHPQTIAEIPKRISALETLAAENAEVGWKALCALLPSQSQVTTGTRHPTWMALPATPSRVVTIHDYWTQVTGMADVVARLAAGNVSRLVELVEWLPDVPDPARSRILAHMESPEVMELPEAARVGLWEGLVDLTGKHRKHRDSNWAMADSDVDRIEQVAQKIAPKSDVLRYGRLFSARDFELFDGEGDYETQRDRLETQRAEMVAVVYRDKGVTGVVELARQAASPATVGQALGNEPMADHDVLPALLLSDDPAERAVARGYVEQRYAANGQSWVDGLGMRGWSSEEQIALLLNLPFLRAVWELADELLTAGATPYWQRVSVNPWRESASNLRSAIERLLQVGRPSAAIPCLIRLAASKEPIPAGLATQVLLGAAQSDGEGVAFRKQELTLVIRALQSDPDVSYEDLFRVEWCYLPILGREDDRRAVTIEQRLADDPEYFVELIRQLYFSEDDTERGEPSETERAAGKRIYHLLRTWRQIPGRQLDGSFDAEKFKAWLARVRLLAGMSGHLGVCMSELGQCLFHSPEDPSELWIHRAIAEALNAKDAERMRSGFTLEAFNSRGVHQKTGGRDERDLARRWRERAESVEQAGFHRFATELRELASGYDRQAEREEMRDSG